MSDSVDGRKTKVGLVQINNSFSGQSYLPYAVGLLQAYVERNARVPDSFEFLLPVYARVPVEQAAAQLARADVIGFSVYVWNIRLSLAIASAVKKRRPETVIVFGGPQVPDRPEDFLRANRCVDLVCHGEGEQVFLAMLENLPLRSWYEVASTSFLTADGVLSVQPRLPRMKDLSVAPSPYLSGTFGRLMEANHDAKWLALWETNRGCPFSCAFCDWGSAVASKVFSFGEERLRAEIDWFAAKRIEFVFCCDANFGILPRDVALAEYAAATKQRTGFPHALSVQNTKNATERAYKVQKLLSDSGLNKGVTISLQSTDASTLASIRRQNISSASFQELQRRFTRDGIETYTDVILGLPGETYSTFANGVCSIIANGQHNRIQFNNLSILPNAEMGDHHYQEKYGLKTIESRITNIHGLLAEGDGDIPEVQQLVIATSSMNRRDWVRARAFSWMAALLHFDKLLQVPFLWLHEVHQVSYRELIELFSAGADGTVPTLQEVRGFFEVKAEEVQAGGPEYCGSREWLGIWWPADEYVLIDLVVSGKVERFYEEAERALIRYLRERVVPVDEAALHEAVELNRVLLKRPFQTEDFTFRAEYNTWEFYKAALVGAAVPSERGQRVYQIDRTSVTYPTWDDWCRLVIWYGNKKGAYLYGNQCVERQLEGHY